MATTYRRRINFIGGVLTAQANGASATAGTSVELTSDGFAALPTLGTDEYVPIVIDPDGIDGAPHIMYLTIHTAGSTAATGLTGQESTTPRAHDLDTPWVHAATVKDSDGRDGGTGLIGLNSYLPGTDQTITASNAGSLGDVDATNMKVTFTAPPSGRVLVRLTAGALAGASANDLIWGLRDGSSDVANSPGKVWGVGSSVTLAVKTAHAFVIGSLTAGTSYTWKWGHRCTGAGTFQTLYGPAWGPAVMEVWGVNV